MQRPRLPRPQHLHLLRHNRDRRCRRRRQRSLAAPAPPAHPLDEFRIFALGLEQEPLAFQRGLQPVGQRQPFVMGTGRQVAEGTDGVLARSVGGVVGLDQAVIGVDAVFVAARVLANIHRHEDIG